MIAVVQLAAEQVDNLKDSIEWYLEDPQASEATADADMYHEFALGEHIGKLGAHGAHADAAEKEVLVRACPVLTDPLSTCSILCAARYACNAYVTAAILIAEVSQGSHCSRM